jgi:hypothetical protein
LPDPGGAGVSKGRQRPAKSEDRAGLVGDRDDAGFQWLARRRIGFGDAAQRLGHRIRTGQSRVRALWAVTRDRDVNEARIDAPQILVAETASFRRTGAEILAENVGFGDEPIEDLAPFGGFQIEGQAFDAAVIGLEIGRGQPRQHGRTARRVAVSRRFDLDDFGTQIGHQHIGDGTGLGG